MHRHLVAVKVCVERGADKRVQFDCPSLNQHRFKSLNSKPVQGRRAVEQHRMVLNHYFESVPDFGPYPLNHFARGFDVAGDTGLHQPLHHKRLEQLKRHFLRQTALVELEFGADHYDRAAGIVNALAQKVLAETALLALEHIRKGF